MDNPPARGLPPLPNVSIDLDSGRLTGASSGYAKRFAELRGVFADDEALTALIEERPEAVAYEVSEWRRSDEAGDLAFGTTVLQPVMVGREFNMTRGHLHRVADRTEMYLGLAGEGALVLTGPDGPSRVVALSRGSVAYVPPWTRHRAVNVGSTEFAFLFCYPADAGQDYDAVERGGGLPIMIVSDGQGGWRAETRSRHLRGAGTVSGRDTGRD